MKNTYPELSEQQMVELTKQKQHYFINNIARLNKNEFLFDIAKMIGRDKCILWSSADQIRIESMVQEFELKRLFCRIIISSKHHIFEDINNICLKLACTKEQLFIFENDAQIAQELSNNHIGCLLYIQPL
ncbi:hypothetical protein FACS1894103_2120 [Campylobacterota bacterium]|nr:hypothetical protein FACS1894103_2120 [Campylobacterota bacterium]